MNLILFLISFLTISLICVAGVIIIVRNIQNARIKKLNYYTKILNSISGSIEIDTNKVLKTKSDSLEKLENSIQKANIFIRKIVSLRLPKYSENDRSQDIVNKISKFLLSDAALMTAAASEHFFYETIEAAHIDPEALIDALNENPDVFIEVATQIMQVGVSPTLDHLEQLKDTLVYLKDIAENASGLDFDLDFTDINPDPSFADVSSHFHIPWITLGISLIREVKLMDEGKTNLDTAIKHMLLDVGGAGVGGAGGAAIGGTILPGFGAIIGGILGALIGRKITNAIKFQPLESAYKKYNSAYERYEKDKQKSSRELSIRISEHITSQTKRFEEETGQFTSVSKHEEITDIAQKIAQAIEKDIAEVKLRIATITTNAKAEFRDRKWHKFFRINIQDYAENTLEKSKQECTTKISGLEDQFHLIRDSDYSSVYCIKEYAKLPKINSGNFEALSIGIEHELEDFMNSQYRSLQTWLDEAQSLRREISKEIQSHWETLLTTEAEKWRKWEANIKNLEAIVEQERQKLGRK